MKIRVEQFVNLEVGDFFRVGNRTYTTAYKDNDKVWFRLINLTDSVMQEIAFDIMEDMFDANFKNCKVEEVIKRDIAYLSDKK